MQSPGDVLKSFTKWQEAPVPESLFDKVADRRSAKSTKRDSNKCFPVNLAKFLKISFFAEHLWEIAFSLWNVTASYNWVSIVWRLWISYTVMALRKTKFIFFIKNFMFKTDFLKNSTCNNCKARYKHNNNK